MQAIYDGYKECVKALFIFVKTLMQKAVFYSN